MSTDALAQDFVAFAVEAGVLRFGEFKTKAGRLSPYFFNAGLFSDGERLGELGRYYARAALASGIGFDVIFGPAYKGITLAAATAISLAGLGHNVPFCFNRKEAKDHGEGGNIVGPLAKRRHSDREDVQPKIQILAEQAFSDGLRATFFVQKPIKISTSRLYILRNRPAPKSAIAS